LPAGSTAIVRASFTRRTQHGGIRMVIARIGCAASALDTFAPGRDTSKTQLGSLRHCEVS